MKYMYQSFIPQIPLVKADLAPGIPHTGYSSKSAILNMALCKTVKEIEGWLVSLVADLCLHFLPR